MGEQQECLTEKPRIKRLIDEHEVLMRERPMNQELLNRVISIGENAMRVAERTENDLKSWVRAMTIVAGVGSSLGVALLALMAFIFNEKNDQILELAREHKVLQQQQTASSAEREVLFKAMLKVIDSKR